MLIQQMSGDEFRHYCHMQALQVKSDQDQLELARDIEVRAQAIMDKAAAELIALTSQLRDSCSNAKTGDFIKTINNTFGDLMGETFAGAVYQMEG